jgi:hypothetical protein
MKRQNKQEMKWIANAIRHMANEGSDPDVMRKMVEYNKEFRQDAIDVGRLLAQDYDSEWLESRRGWLEAYRNR